LRIIPYQPFQIDRPFELEQLLCFTDVQINVSDFLSWRDPASTDVDSDTKPRNERNAGRKPTENWPEIVKWIEGALDDGAEWESWLDLWCDIPPRLKREKQNDEVKDPSSKLRLHLRRHQPKLDVLVRNAIKSIRS
jgi:hypothetical protein